MNSLTDRLIIEARRLGELNNRAVPYGSEEFAEQVGKVCDAVSALDNETRMLFGDVYPKDQQVVMWFKRPGPYASHALEVKSDEHTYVSKCGKEYYLDKLDDVSFVTNPKGYQQCTTCLRVIEAEEASLAKFIEGPLPRKPYRRRDGSLKGAP